MTKKVSNYLKVYDGDADPVVLPTAEQLDQIERLSSAFLQATGTRLDAANPANESNDAVAPLSLTAESAAETGAVDQLAAEISGLLAELKRTQRALWQREGELAAAIPLVVRPEDEPGQLAERLETVLRGAAQAVDCQAAGLYLLDDDTRFLKLRASWGLPPGRLAAEPRRLRGSKADLEALTGHAVALERATRFEHWNAPEEFGSAVCVPVSTATVPLGTLWVFGHHERSFRDEQVHIVEIVAGRVAAELEREILLRHRLDANPHEYDGLDEAVRLQNDRWPEQISLAGWQLAALPSTTPGQQRLIVDALRAHVFDDFRLGLTLAHAHDASLAGALTAATFSGAAQLVCKTLDPASRLGRINDAVATLSAGDQACSALTATFTPEADRFAYCTAGHVSTYRIGPHGWEELGGRSTAVGITADAEFRTSKLRIEPGDLVLFIVAPPERPSRADSNRYLGANDLAELFLRHHHFGAAELVELAERTLRTNPIVWPHRPTLLIARRD